MQNLLDKFNKAQSEVKKVIIGKDYVIQKVFEAILAKGHVLIEDIPGVGKTTLAMSFSKVMSLKYKRIQFTPDVLPSDVSGFSMYNRQTNEFEYVEGAAMCNLLLADEINRTSPKTQSALLEIMEEGHVTVDGQTKEIPKPFTVIATQNPFGSVGTQKLPESQMDRFIIRVSMGYPDYESEINIYSPLSLRTVTLQAAYSPRSVMALMVASPALRPVTRPSPSTVATVGLLLIQTMK